MHECFILTEDGINIACNHYEGSRGSCVILAPGWSMNKDTSPFRRLSELFFQHHDVLAMDFRGHGRSSGRFTFTAHEVYDLAAVVAFARKRYQRIAVIGFSLGAATSILHCAAQDDVDVLIAVSPPSNVYKIENHFWRPAAIRNSLKKKHFRERWGVRPGNVFLRKIQPIDAVQRLQTPALFMAGEEDPTVHAWHTEQLYNVASTPHKKLDVFENAYHAEDLFLEYPERFARLCQEWLTTHLSERL